MTIKVSKPSINLREALSDLKQDTGLKGQELMRADTVAEARTAIGAGRKNLIINGGFDVWQRGASTSVDTQTHYGADRWREYKSGGTAGSTRQTFTVGQTEVPNNPKYYIKYSVSLGNNYTLIGQRVEDIAQFSGQTFTVSFWARGVNPTAAGSLQLRFSHYFGTGGSPSSGFSVFLTDVTLTTSWTKYVRTVTVPSMSGKVFGTDDNSYMSIDLLQGGGDTSTNAWHIDLTQVQLELGSVATEFEHRSYGEELALCQRYYQIHYSMGSGVQNSSTMAFCAVQLPVAMRNRPTLGTKSGLWSNINLERSDTYDVTSASTIGHGSSNNDLDSMSSFFVSFYTTGSRIVGEGIAAACDRNSDHFTLSAEL
jgi:hypothetical protein